jgi:hypothetical protein
MSRFRVAIVAWTCALLLAFVVSGLAQTELLRSSAPGAFAVRYLPDRAIASSSTAAALELRLWLPQKPLWYRLDGQPQPADGIKWVEDAKVVQLSLPGGSHELQVGWQGTGETPPPGQKIDVLVDGKKVGELATTFALESMTAEGSVVLATSTSGVALDAAAGATIPDGTTLSVGTTPVTEWQPTPTGVAAKTPLWVGGDSLVRLTVPGYNLLYRPVSCVRITTISKPTDVVRVDAIPDGAIIVEAEDFIAEGAGKVSVSVGEHLDQHGGKSIFNYGSGGHWLQWRVEIPADGEYDMYARIAEAEEFALRGLSVDDALQAAGFATLKLPGTGGWAHAPGEWWLVKIAGASSALPPLKLTKGTHTFRMWSVAEQHLNLDYFAFVKR